MQPNDHDSAKTSTENSPSGPGSGRSRSLFDIPEPVKRVFDKVPLVTYQPNELPQRTLSAHARNDNTLHVFTTAKDARRRAPSFNPGCLKWQAFLRFSGIDFQTVSSNNHASPTGALPFLLPARSATTAAPPNPVPSSKLEKWAGTQKTLKDEPLGMRYEAYLSLLDFRIRNAWLYTLYLDDRNFEALARPLYITPCSSNFLVRAYLSRQLRQAARDELLKQSNSIDVDDLYAEASNAFSALSTLLGKDVFFFDRETPGLFDASVFAYTHLLMDHGLEWKNKRLAQMVEKHQNLVQHRQRLLEGWFEKH